MKVCLFSKNQTNSTINNRCLKKIQQNRPKNALNCFFYCSLLCEAEVASN